MNQNNLTLKSQEAVQAAQQFAESNSQQALETSHLLKGIFSVDENVLPFILKKCNVNIDKLKDENDKLIEALPKVEGGRIYLSDDFNKTFQKAASNAKDMGDDFISLEHLFLAMIN